MIKFLSEFGPLVAFFIGYKYGGIQGATFYMLAASLIGIAICYYVERKIQTFSLISSGILIISAIVTLLSGNAMFIKMKPTVLYVIFSGTLFWSAFKDRPLIKYLLNHIIPLEEKCWSILSYRFGIFFLIMAVVNEIMWRNFDEALWVKFKVFGAIPITLLFMLAQIPLILKNKRPD